MYQVILESQPERFLKKLDKENQRRIVNKLKLLETNPQLGKPLVTNLSGLWSLRIGDYKAIYQIRNQELLILVLKLGHRKDVYG